jgi:hypothetical protein
MRDSIEQQIEPVMMQVIGPFYQLWIGFIANIVDSSTRLAAIAVSTTIKVRISSESSTG